MNKLGQGAKYFFIRLGVKNKHSLATRMMNNDGWWKKITLIGLSYLFFITKSMFGQCFWSKKESFFC